MIPQTNLQLYRLLAQANTDVESLARVRAAYDIARRLFANAFRPSHKPFLCHLVGVAGGLASWRQPVELTIAGLLHSAYLYGQFGDRAKGATLARRNWLRPIIGQQAEELIYDYTRMTWDHWTAEGLLGKIDSDARLKRATIIKLADLLDELCDLGPKHAPAKTLEFGLLDGADFPVGFLPLVERCAGRRASEQFREVFFSFHSSSPPDCLRTADRSFHIQQTGVPDVARFRIARTLGRLRQRFFWSRAA